MQSTRVIFTILAVAAVAVGCAGPQRAASLLRDGELVVPSDYKAWPKFLSKIQRADNKQVREIYINRTGVGAKRGEAFPAGTVMVMEIYKAGPGADGKLEKGELTKVFVMGKDPGWGNAVTPAGLKNGDWVYAAYNGDAKTPSGDNIAQCRACHLPLVKQDFVHRCDEYFDKRAH